MRRRTRKQQTNARRPIYTKIKSNQTHSKRLEIAILQNKKQKKQKQKSLNHEKEYQ